MSCLHAELDRAVQQARATCTALAALGVEMRSVVHSERDDPGLCAAVLMAHSQRAALALTTLTGTIGQIELLARLGAP